MPTPAPCPASRRRRTALPTALAASLLIAAGCGEPALPGVAPVHGTVTYKGKPVTSGSVIFMPTAPPADGLPLPATGDIGPDGTYKLASQAGPGAILGDHKVIVYAVENTPAAGKAPKADVPADPNAPPPKSDAGGRLKSILPKKYESPDTTPLTKSVKSGDNAIDLELVD